MTSSSHVIGNPQILTKKFEIKGRNQLVGSFICFLIFICWNIGPHTTRPKTNCRQFVANRTGRSKTSRSNIQNPFAPQQNTPSTLTTAHWQLSGPSMNLIE
jgi:hypothetical protein